MTHYYVWYRVAGDPAAARPAIDALIAAVAAGTGVRGRLLLGREDPRTWMEIYEAIADADGFERALTACVAKHDAARWAEGRSRHVEAFIDPRQ